MFRNILGRSGENSKGRGMVATPVRRRSLSFLGSIVFISRQTVIFLCIGLGGSGCEQSVAESAPAPLSKVAALTPLWEELPLDRLEEVMVPPEEGPKLAPLSLATRVFAEPSLQSEKTGYLRLGARVARSEQEVSRADCPGGWYAIRPLGFVCAGERATVNLEHPLARAVAREPDRARAMPYSYAFVRAIAPNYLRVPKTEEQFASEMRLERHLRNWKKLTTTWDSLEVGANDVPLNDRGAAQGKIPKHAITRGMSQRFGGNGTDAVPWWLKDGRQIPNVSSFQAPAYAVMANRIQRHAGVALIDSFVAGPEAQERRFAVTTDARILPADKLKADSGSPFHGTELRDQGLPVAFARRPNSTFWSIEGNDFEALDKLGKRQFVPLTGKVKNVRGIRVVEARNGKWLRSADLHVAAKPRELPWFAHKKERWIDISIVNQTMVLWEGDRAVYATLVSTGRDGLGDPKKTLSTPQGVFRIRRKHVTTTMDSDVADKEFELRDVPWVMYFKGGYALHGAYWHDDFGRTRSHGCVNLAPIDARYAFEWSLPDVPAHWHGAYASEKMGKGTILRIGR